jgi:zinc protease
MARRQFWLPPAAIAALLLVVTAASGMAQRTLDAVLRDTILENGLHVIVVPNPAVPLVTIQVTVRNGAFTQVTGDLAGIPHLLEHMLFRSFGRNGFGEEASKIDASYNGTTDDETVTYYITLPASNVGRGMQLMADLMRDPRFERAALQSEQRVVRGELERSVADPNFLLRSVVNQRLWGTAWNRKNAIGNAMAIEGATPALLKQVYERFYVPNNAAVVITGDVTPEDAFALAARHFSRWRRGADPFKDLELAPMPPLRANQVVTANLEANDVTLLIAWQGPSVRSEPGSACAADLFASIVNDRISGMQSRLVDTGLFQSLGMGHVTRAYTGPITIRATTNAELLVEASVALRAELLRIADAEYVTDEALQIAKKRQEVGWAMEMELPSGLAWFVGDLWSVSGGIEYVRGYLAALGAIETADLKLFVDTYLARKPRVTGVMLSPSTRQELGPRLQEALAHWRQ